MIYDYLSTAVLVTDRGTREPNSRNPNVGVERVSQVDVDKRRPVEKKGVGWWKEIEKKIETAYN